MHKFVMISFFLRILVNCILCVRFFRPDYFLSLTHNVSKVSPIYDLHVSTFISSMLSHLAPFPTHCRRVLQIIFLLAESSTKFAWNLYTKYGCKILEYAEILTANLFYEDTQSMITDTRQITGTTFISYTAVMCLNTVSSSNSNSWKFWHSTRLIFILTYIYSGGLA